ncbi:flagellar basal body L-ring protein FlgH [Sphingomonas ginkgonis]|uniref:Flagellar L-ring protein n=1 Tax=Sphingomonas ginkgonis TaxID=2315330 RepID=A0A3R9YNI8_9SPHN|nr:flagellar basal body L-ring protein FlgH [Sphingomonas ginkgonis]RST31543.1 flagellar basal body L-ring protein FlgH [Sphingomonas ginkgonis]
MPTSSSDRIAGALALLAAALVATGAEARGRAVQPDYAPTYAAPLPPQAATGAIFQGSFTPLTSGNRAGNRGDLLTIDLVERTSAQKATSAKTGRDGSIGLSPPVTGPLSFFTSTDINAGGSQSFKGEGSAAQSNQLSGQLSVTIAEVYPNGTMLVRGEKLLTLNRGDERVQFSGIVRAADISADNRVVSTRVADARILYTGKGEIARASRQGWLQRFFSVISPF